MPQEMIVEDVPWESDEAEDWESDESILEADYESSEDIGERARRRRRYGPGRPSRVAGIPGITARTADGRVRNLPKLATAREANGGFARQALAHRALEKRVAMQPKNESSVSGLVTLAIGGGLAVWGAVKASEKQRLTFANWANNENTQIAALISASQLVTTGAKLAIDRRYLGSTFGIAADAFAAAQLAAFAFGKLYVEAPKATRRVLAVENFANLPLGTVVDLNADYVTNDNGNVYTPFYTNGSLAYAYVNGT